STGPSTWKSCSPAAPRWLRCLSLAGPALGCWQALLWSGSSVSFLHLAKPSCSSARYALRKQRIRRCSLPTHTQTTNTNTNCFCNFDCCLERLDRLSLVTSSQSLVREELLLDLGPT